MIKINRLTDYAIVLLSQMIKEKNDVFAASKLAEQTQLPLPTVSKILKKLAKSGIVLAHRGVSGGYKLGSSASQISLATIIEAMDGPIAITDCSNNDMKSNTCRIEKICPMRVNWSRVNDALRATLEDVALADMLRGEVRLCDALPDAPIEQRMQA